MTPKEFQAQHKNLNRRSFLKSLSAQAALLGICGTGGLAGCIGKRTVPIEDVTASLGKQADSELMPTVFVAHGSPMNAISENGFTKSLQTLGRSLPTPTTIVMISAHWQTYGTVITSMDRPEMVYDVTGFPKALYDINYDCPGNPKLADELCDQAPEYDLQLSSDWWGLDHGSWSVLVHLFPKADIPVLQMSLAYGVDTSYHYDLAAQLAPWRRKGVLFIGSGNLVHNLVNPGAKGGKEWAHEFDTYVETHLNDRNDEALIHYKQAGDCATFAHPTDEHYLPLLYTLGMSDKEEPLRYPYSKFHGDVLSMRCVQIGR